MGLYQIRRSFAFSEAAGRLWLAALGHGQILLFARLSAALPFDGAAWYTRRLALVPAASIGVRRNS
jgi:hypothetical protein